MLALVVEVGGTTTRVTSCDGTNEGRSDNLYLPTPNYLSHPATTGMALIAELFERIRCAAGTVLAGQPPDLVVMAYPGPLSEDGVALRSPTILGPTNETRIDVKGQLRKLWPHAGVQVINDLTAAGYFFVHRGWRDFCVITVGSGIGNKVFVHGQPQLGPQGIGGEIGHLKAQPKPGSPVASIHRDLGEIASGRGTTWLARLWLAQCAADASHSMLGRLRADADDDTWSRALVRAFGDADSLAESIVEATAYPLAHALSALHMGLGLEKFFIVGGFAHALGPRYGSVLARLAGEACWDLGQRWHEIIEVGSSGEEEGLAGACHLARLLMQDSRSTPREAA
jgi:predicted NBD/HSP70 family sugar kinase